MRMRIKLKRLFLLLCTLFICALACGCRSILSGCASWRKYSLDFVENTYKISNYQDNGVFTPETTLRVTFTEPEEKTEFTSSCLTENGYVYFIFENLQPNITAARFSNIANRQPAFHFYHNEVREFGFRIYSLDWNEAFYVSNSDITFSKV